MMFELAHHEADAGVSQTFGSEKPFDDLLVLLFADLPGPIQQLLLIVCQFSRISMGRGIETLDECHKLALSRWRKLLDVRRVPGQVAYQPFGQSLVGIDQRLFDQTGSESLRLALFESFHELFAHFSIQGREFRTNRVQ